jgi:8-oxo-dGTP pyrophosphatase MutT (NUDIX family)
MLWTPADVQELLARAHRRSPRKVIHREGLIPAAVLIPLITPADETELLLTLRTDSVETHKGHVAFPGGAVDAEDADRTATALRETEEELGISPADIITIGALDDLATPTGFIITPVIGFLRGMPALSPNPGEVAEVFMVPLAFLFAEGSLRKEKRKTEFGHRDTWRCEYAGKVIWGATAAMIKDLQLLLQPPSSVG